MIVAACFFADDGWYPNIKARDKLGREALYWRCMAGMLETARRFSSEPLRLMIFSNSSPTDEIRRKFDVQQASIVSLPYETRVPGGAGKLFSGSLYTIDAIRWAGRELADNETILFLDPDCIVTDDLAPVADAIRSYGLVAYDLRMSRAAASNGLSRDGIGAICGDLHGASPTPPRWLGGELLGIRGDVARKLSPPLEAIWEGNIERFEAGRPALRTEEHLLSALVACEGVPFFDAGDGFVKRLWTGTRYRNHSPSDVDNLVWHLPSEKNRGFQRLYSLIGCDHDAWSADRAARKQALAILFGLRNDRIGEATYICRRTLSEVASLMMNRTQRFSVGI